MKRLATLIVILLAAAMLSACGSIVYVSSGSGPSITGSGKLVEKSFDLAGFTRIESAAGATVEITNADTPSVKVTTDDNAVDHLKVEKRGDTLVIGMQDGSYKNVTLKAAIAMPELLGVTASGGSKVNFDEFTTTKPVAFETSGGAGITGTMNAGTTDVRASGGADLALTGKGDGLTLRHSGGGHVNLAAYPVTDANVNVSGGSQSEINANGSVTGSVSGGGLLRLSGQPASVEVKQSGGGRVVR